MNKKRKDALKYIIWTIAILCGITFLLVVALQLEQVKLLILPRDAWWLMINIIGYFISVTALRVFKNSVSLGEHIYFLTYLAVVMFGYLSYRYLFLIEMIQFRDMMIGLKAGVIGWMGCLYSIFLFCQLPSKQIKSYNFQGYISKARLQAWFYIFLTVSLIGTMWYLIKSQGIIPILMEDKNLGKALSMEISPISQAMMFQGLGAASIGTICYLVSDSRILDKIVLGLRIIASSTGFILLTSRQHIAMVAGLIAIVLLYRKPVKAFIILLMSYCLLVIIGFMRYTEVYREKVAGHYLFFADFFGQLRFFPDLYEVFKNSPKLAGKTYVGALSSLFPSELFSLFGLNKEDYYLIAGRYAKDLLRLKFSGGGIGISALGELYINFGMPGIFFGFSVLTLIILFISKKLLKNRENPEYFVFYILNILFLTLFLLLSSTVILPQYIFVIIPLYCAVLTLRKAAEKKMLAGK